MFFLTDREKSCGNAKVWIPLNRAENNRVLIGITNFLQNLRIMSEQNSTKENISRRKFVKAGVVTAGAFMIVPRHVLGGKGFIAPSDKLNIAGIGAGGKAWDNIPGAYKDGQENIVALCDVDDNRAAEMYQKFPNAKRYKDFRVMLEQQKDIDAVMVTTPDHTHAIATLTAMQLGKHVYTEKPLTYSIQEARVLAEAAKRYPKLATQMGNQGSSGDDMRKVQEWIAAGVIGDVKRVHVWSDRPVWIQGVPTPKEAMPVPAGLDWDLWLGPAAWREYHSVYMPFRWRGWWDFGTGALGDMGCHLIDVPFRALQLTYPVSVEASMSQAWINDFESANLMESAPMASIVHFQFPKRGKMPAVELIWYDGGIQPKRPEELATNKLLDTNGVLFEGSKGKMLCSIFGDHPEILPAKRMQEFKAPKPTLARVPGGHQEGHHQNWVSACKNGTPTSSPFEYACKLTETVLIGNLAIRSHNIKGKVEGTSPEKWWENKEFPGRTKLLWDAAQMKITNFDEANQFVQRKYREGWSLSL
jgi:predicted dehydrogenase